jgi:hypothetical protein
MATTVVSQANSESVVNIATFKLTTDAATAAAYTLALGFTPRRVKIVNITDVLTDEWMDGMGANTALHQVGSTGVVTSTTGITVNPPANDGSGNSVTFAAAIMIASKTFHVIAEG